MKNEFVAVIDSGIGGFSVLVNLIKLMPNERYLYFSDSKNLPYGNKSIDCLWEITKRNLEEILKYKIKVLVVGCNTLSVNLLEKISAYAKVKTFGVFPPVFDSLNYSKNTLLLCTNATAKKYAFSGIDVLALNTLAESIEKHKFELDKIDINHELENSNFYSLNNSVFETNRYDTLILGCTHYFFVQNKIIDHFRPLKIFCGEKYSAESVFLFLQSQKSLGNNKQFSIKFIGEDAEINKKFWDFGGQNY